MRVFWYLGSRYKYTFAHDVCCELYISFSGAKTDIVEVNLGKNNKTLQHSVSSSSVYMCLLYFLLLCFVFRHLINVCIESLRNMHLNFVNHVILICKQDLHLRTDVSCLGIGITIILYNEKIIQFTVLHAYSCY